jgi:hypothetical protein
MQDLILKMRSNFNGLTNTDGELIWSTGVLEYWSVGKSESPIFNLSWFFHYSIAPALHHSSRLSQKAKPHSNSLRGESKAKSFGTRFLSLGGLQ